jgi:hypothetical protein
MRPPQRPTISTWPSASQITTSPYLKTTRRGTKGTTCPTFGVPRLLGLPNRTATVLGQQAARSYLYFFPDWDDYVREPFVRETDEGDASPQERLSTRQG